MKVHRSYPNFVLLSMLTAALSACGGSRAFSPQTSGQAAARTVRPDALQQNNGAQFVEFPTLCAVPLGQIAHGTTTASMWFTVPAGCGSGKKKKGAAGAVGSVGIATGQVTEFALESGASPLAIAENADYVWAADQNKTKKGTRLIYRFNEDGTYSTFALPNAIVVGGLVAGPDGNLWFCGSYAQKKTTLAGVGYVTPAGASTLYEVKGSSTPILTSIAAGSDGNLYVTDENGYIDQVAPASGAITTFSVGGHPLSITNSSNVMVYSDASVGQLSVIDKTGEFTVYPAPSGQHPGFLARKSDGTVLYVDTSDDSSSIGTFDPSTDTYEAEAQAPHSGLRYLFNGPDGNMWYTDNVGYVGAYLKFVLTTAPASLSLELPPCTASFTPSETNYTGSFSVSSQSSNIASVSPPSGNAGTAFTVTGVAAGSTSITVADSMGNVTGVPVSVGGACFGTSDVVYVSDNSQVLIYDSATQTQIGTISQGIGGPTGEDVDASGNLYVANSNDGNGVEFLAGQSSPANTFSSPGNNPWDITKCPDGTVYVAPLGSQDVAIYANGSSSPTGTIANSDSGGNFAVHCDPSANVYVLYYSDQYGAARVKEYGPGGAGKGTLLGPSGGSRSSMTIDQAADVVFANDTTNGIEFWAQGGTQPYKVLTTFEGIGILQYVKFDASEALLWVQVSQGGGTYAYGIDPGNGTIVYQLPYVSAGGPGLAVYPADSFTQNDKSKARPAWRNRPHWNPPTEYRPQPAPSPFTR
jgi:streptogramin lyase